jgi:hypothetical protein
MHKSILNIMNYDVHIYTDGAAKGNLVKEGME